MKREDFVSDLAWERYVEERSCCRKLYQKQGFWCLAIVILFIIVAAIKTVLLWPGGASCIRWDEHKNNTAYYVRNRRILYGPKDHAETGGYQNYIKCTFYGIDTPDFDVASDDELRSLLGI